MGHGPIWGSLNASSIVRYCGAIHNLQPQEVMLPTSGRQIWAEYGFSSPVLSEKNQCFRLFCKTPFAQHNGITDPTKAHNTSTDFNVISFVGAVFISSKWSPSSLPDLLETYRLWKPFHTPFIFILYKDYFSKALQAVGCKKPLMITIFSLLTSVSVLKTWASLMSSTRKYKL